MVFLFLMAFCDRLVLGWKTFFLGCQSHFTARGQPTQEARKVANHLSGGPCRSAKSQPASFDKSCSNFLSQTKNQELYRKETSFPKMWIFSMSLSKGSENEVGSSPSKKAVSVHPWPSPIFAFEVLVLKRNDAHKDIQTSQPGKTHLFCFNKASGCFCPFRWNEEETATLGGIDKGYSILGRPAEWKSSLKKSRFIS